MRAKERVVHGEENIEESHQVGCAGLGVDDEFNSVAGGKDHRFADAWGQGQRPRRLGESLGWNRQLLTQFDRGGLVVDAKEQQVAGVHIGLVGRRGGDRHGIENLWTELKTFAAQTLSMTTKTRLDQKIALRPRRPVVRRTSSIAM